MNSIIEAQQTYLEYQWIPHILAPGMRMHSYGNKDRDREYDALWRRYNNFQRATLIADKIDEQMTQGTL